VAWAWTKGTPR